MAEWWETEEDSPVRDTVGVSTTDQSSDNNWWDMDAEASVSPDENVSERHSQAGGGLLVDLSVLDNEDPSGFSFSKDDMIKKSKEFGWEVYDAFKGQVGYGLAQANAMVGVGMGSLLEMFSTAMPDTNFGKKFLKEKGQAIREYYDDWGKNFRNEEYEVNPLDNPMVMLDPGFYIYQTIKQTPMLVAGAANPAYGALVGAEQIAGSTFNEMKKEGYSDEESAKAAAVDASLGGWLDKLGLGAMFKSGGSAALRFLKGYLGEASTEGAQNIESEMVKSIYKGFEDGKTSDEILYDFVDRKYDILREAAGDALVGGAIGGPIAFISGDSDTGEKKKKKDPKMDEQTRKLKEDLLSVLAEKSAQELADVRNEVIGTDTSTDGQSSNLSQSQQQEMGKPLYTVDPVMGAMENKYNSEGKLIGQVQLPQAPHDQQRVRRDISSALPNPQQGQQTVRRVPLGESLRLRQQEIEYRLANGDDAIEVIQSMLNEQRKASEEERTKYQEGQRVAEEIRSKEIGPKSAAESARVFEETGKGRLEDAIDTFEGSTIGTGDELVNILKEKAIGPKSAEESAQVLKPAADQELNSLIKSIEATGKSTPEARALAIKQIEERRSNKPAQESAQVFEQAGESETERILNDIAGKGYPGSVSENIIRRLGKVAFGPKSAQQSAEVFEGSEKGRLEDAIDTFEGSTIGTGDEIVNEIKGKQVGPKSAEQSAEVLKPEADRQMEAMLNSVKALQNVTQQDRMNAIMSLTEPKSEKSAEESSKVWRPEVVRVEKAKADFEKAFLADDQEAMDVAVKELSEALRLKDKAEGIEEEPIGEIEREPAQKPARKNIQIQEGTDALYDQDGGSPILTVASPEQILEGEQEVVEDMLYDIKPEQKAKVDPRISAEVQSPEGQELVQGLIDNDKKAIKAALNKFPVGDRKKAYDHASRMALSIAKKTGSFDVRNVRYSVEDNRKLVKHSGEKQQKELRVKKIERGIWQVKNLNSGKTFNIFSNAGKFTLNEGKKTIGEFDTVKDAIAATKEAPEVKYTVKKNMEAGANNKFEVHGPDGIVSSKKVGGGKGYKTEKAAKSVANKLNNVTPGKSTEKATKVNYPETSRTFLDESVPDSTPRKATQEGQKPTVIVRKSETSTKGQVDKKEAPRASEEEKTDKPINASSIEIPGKSKSMKVSGKGLLAHIRKLNDPDLNQTLDTLMELVPEMYLRDIQYEITDQPSDIGVPGMYFPKDNKVIIYRTNSRGKKFSDKTIAETILHETIHGVTSSRLESNKVAWSKLTDLRLKLAEKILSPGAYELMSQFDGDQDSYNSFILKHVNGGGTAADLGCKNIAELQAIYFLLNNKETLAGVASKEFKRALEQTQSDGPITQFIEQVKTILKRILGWNDKQVNYYEEVMATIGSLYSESMDDAFIARGEETLSAASEVFDRKDPDKDVAWLGELIEREKEKLKEEAVITPHKDNWFKRTVIEPMETFKDVALTINDRLEVIHPRLAFIMRSEEGEMLRKNRQDQATLLNFRKNFNRVTRKLPKEMIERVKLGLLNNELDVVEAVMKSDEELAKAWTKISAVRDRIKNDLIDTGALREDQLVEGYLWHREVDDLQGLIKAMSEDKDMSFVEHEVKAAMPDLMRLGMDETQARQYVINSLMTTGRFPATMRVAKATRDRKFVKVPRKYYQFYKDPIEAMGNHIEESNEVVAMRRVVGSTSLKRSIAELKSIENKIEKEESPEAKRTLQDMAMRLSHSIDLYANSLEDSVSGFVTDLVEKGTIPSEKRDEVIKLIRGRITQRGISNATLQRARNVGLGVALGHFSNTLTQLKDGSLILYRHGIYNSTKALLQTLTRQNNISATDYDLQRVMNEFRKNKGMDLNKIFFWTGFTSLDNALKTVNLQAHINKMKSMAKTDKGANKLRKKYGMAWGTDLTEKIISDLKEGNVTPDVQNIAITELARDVPVFLSEMPYAYNQGGNARIAYTLKSYAVKIFNVAYRDGVRKAAFGKGTERLAGLVAMARLAVFAAAIGAGVDELKDWLVGKRTPFVENAMDELLNIVFLSRYTLDKAAKRGPSEVIGSLFSLPAMNLVDAMAKALKGDMDVIKYIPIPGVKELYMRESYGGRKKVIDYNRQKLFAVMKDEIQDEGRLSKDTRRMISEYNQDIKKFNIKYRDDIRDDSKKSGKEAKLKPVTFSTIKRNRKRWKKDE